MNTGINLTAALQAGGAMMTIDLNSRKAWVDRRELSYDLYPGDKRVKKPRPSVTFKQAIRDMGHENNRIEYDIDPGISKRL